MKRQSLLLIFLLSMSNAVTFAAEDAPQVIVKDFKFIPQEITIKRGQTITWLNQEKRQYHSVWFEASGEEESDYIFPDESYAKEFKQTGVFPYRCGPHPRMIATVHVIE